MPKRPSQRLEAQPQLWQIFQYLEHFRLSKYLHISLAIYEVWEKFRAVHAKPLKIWLTGCLVISFLSFIIHSPKWMRLSLLYYLLVWLFPKWMRLFITLLIYSHDYSFFFLINSPNSCDTSSVAGYSLAGAKTRLAFGCSAAPRNLLRLA